MTESIALEIHESKIHGLGCFSTSVISRGQVIVEYVGELIDYAEAVRRNVHTSRDHSEYILQVSNKVFIDGARSGNFSRYINHSCEPNCRVWRVDTRAFMVARRQISARQELTIDYSYDLAVREPCFCGAQTCRGYM